MNKMARIGPYLSIIKYRWTRFSNQMTEWFNKKIRPNCILPRKTHFSFKDTHRLKVKGCKNIFHVNGNQKKAEITTLI